MDDMEILIKGALLHDIGKVCYRAGKRINHSEAGYKFLQENRLLTDDEENERIFRCIRYHHKDYLKNVVKELSDCDLAYIVYEADNIAAAMDRRDEGSDSKGFTPRMALESVFDIFSGQLETKNKYKLATEYESNSFNYPSAENIELLKDTYALLVAKMRSYFERYNINTISSNQLLQIIENLFRYVPSSTNIGEVADISLYVHCKITAAVASCMKQYFDENDEFNYKSFCYGSKVTTFRKKAVFKLFAGDISGIQNFIYTIPSKGALKSLRGRSFYLEIFMENFIDELLNELNLSRANILYSGGGNFYLLLPATKKAEEAVRKLHIACNEWLLENFGEKLYLAVGTFDCSASDLMQKDREYTDSIFSAVNRKINQDKANRYDENLLKELFSSGGKYTVNQDKSRECSVCHNSSAELAVYDDEKLICPICKGLYTLGENILKNDSMFIISREKKSDAMPIFGFEDGYYLYAVNDEQLGGFTDIVRIYSKNTIDIDKNTIRLWLADYCIQNDKDTVMTFDELAQKSKGIKRLGVLRADVDNLGTAFIGGFVRNGEDKFKYATISRYANLSEDLSMFFKSAVNNICSGNLTGLDSIKETAFNIFNCAKDKQRKVHIVYSGGDDVFLVGAWDDLLEVAVDIYRAFKQFTNGKLTFSAGMAMFTPSYPVSKMAEITGILEDASKNVQDKDSISLFGFETKISDENGGMVCRHTYKWDEFINKVWREKLLFILGNVDFNNSSAVKLNLGKTAVYRFMKLVQLSEDEKFNLARFAYVLARMQPKEQERLAAYNRFSEKIYKWIRNPQDKKEFNTALNLLVYYLRETE